MKLDADGEGARVIELLFMNNMANTFNWNNICNWHTALLP